MWTRYRGVKFYFKILSRLGNIAKKNLGEYFLPHPIVMQLHRSLSLNLFN